ncbi:MAG TPA: NosD domain-containing protein [Candidatus Acidoferrales bacterium]|nr:NosD domain-containing protein [Candidatus Acidoferrales bacterium]
MKTSRKLTIICVLLCLSFLNLTSFGVIAQSAGAIVINADGSVSGTSLIQHQGNVYRFMGNIQDSPITVLCCNIVLDGEGFSLQGAGGWGTPGVAGLEDKAAIDLTCSNVPVQDFVISGWETGVAGAYDGNTVEDNNISRTENAIAIYADNYNVNGNCLANSIYGVYIKGSSNLVSQNQITDSYCGIMIFPTLKNTITKNNFTENGICFTIGTYEDFNYLIYDNNFIIGPNTTIVSTNSDDLGPTDTGTLPPWDNGSVGNFWSDYMAKYPNATQIGNSSIGDTAYLIRTDPTMIDRFPLMLPALTQNANQASSNQTTNTNWSTTMLRAEPTDSSQSAKSTSSEISFIAAASIAGALFIVLLAFRKKLFWLQKGSNPP